MRVAILTISDRSARGERPDEGGPLIAQLISQTLKWDCALTKIIPDDYEQIRQTLIGWCDAHRVDLILTTGGTGLAPRDVTPEATKAVIEREVPGIPEALRAASLKITQHAMLSRAIAGTRKQTLIINLPGNPKAVRENLEVLLPVLPHALNTLHGEANVESEHRVI